MLPSKQVQSCDSNHPTRDVILHTNSRECNSVKRKLFTELPMKVR